MRAADERKAVLQDAAERVRAARTLAAIRQDEQSANELIVAMAEFERLHQDGKSKDKGGNHGKR